MPTNIYPLIAKEGWGVLVFLFVAATITYFFINTTVSLFLLSIICIVAFLLRDPPRLVPALPLALVSPVHGKIVSTKTVDDPWISRETKAVRIRIRMSIFDIYSLRSPIEGKVINQWAYSPNGEYTDRRFVYWIRTDEADDVVVAIQLNVITAHIFRFYLHSGERVGQGQRCGFLGMGGMIEVYAPENCKIDIEPGQSIDAGSGVLAHLVHG